VTLPKGLLLLVALSAAAQTIIEPRVVSETLPSGGLIQIKLDFTSPHPITTTSSDFSFDSAFESVEGVSILSPSGDAYGVGYARNARFHANIVSPLASLGTQLDYPFLMVAAKIRSGIPVGTVIPISFGTATFFNGPGGAPYSLPAPKNGALTIGGSASITNVVPGGGVLPAGTTVRILGTGFNASTRIDVNEVKISNFRYVSSTEIDFTMSASGDLTGTRFVLRGQNKDPDVTYFSYLRAVSVGSSSRALLNGCHPLYPTQFITSAGIAVPATGLSGFIGIALRNSSFVASDVQLELVSSAGASLGKVSVSIPSGGQYLRTVQELFGPAPAGAAVKVATSAAIQVLGLNGDDTTGAVSAFLPGPAPAVTSAALAAAPTALTFDAVSGAAAPAAKSVSITATGAAVTFASTSNAAWLTATPSGGSTQGAVSVSVNPAGLAAGAYSGTLTFTATGASAVTVPVTLIIAPASQLSVGPAALAFTSVAGAAAPPSKPLSVSTIGAALSFTAATNAAWLSASPASGTTPATVTVSVNPAGLAAGVYSGQINLTAPGASPQTVAVTFTVTAVPVLTLSPASLTFTAAGTQSVALGSTGAALPYTTSSNAAWLTALPAAGTTPGTSSISVNPTGLAPGNYAGVVTVTPTGAAAQTVAVTLNLAPPAQLSLSPSALVFDGVAGAASPASKSIAVASTASALAYSVTSSAAWLSASPAAGATPANAVVTANTTGLAVGTYSGTLTFTPPAGSTTQTVAVTLNVTPAPQLAVTPAALTFDAQTGGAAPAAKSLNIASPGTPLNFAVSTNAAWLSASPSTGATPSPVSVSVYPAGLAVGSNSGTITISAPGATAQTVAVTLNITAAPQLAASPSLFAFTAVAGGAAPAAQGLQITSTGAALPFTATSNDAWLSAAPNSGTTPAALNVSVSPAGLAPGVYHGTISLASPGAITQTVSAVLTVTAAPQLSVSPSALVFDGAGSRSISVASSGAGLSYSASANVSWLSVSPATGSTPATLSATANVTGVTPGSYTGLITITAAGATAQTVAVSLNVVAAPQLTLSPSSLTFSGAGSQSVTVGSTGSVLSYSASSNAAWLIVSPASGAAPGSLSATTNVSGLAPGTYSGLITVSAPGATTQTVAVTLTVASVSPQLTVSPASLSFDGSGVRSLSVGSNGAVLNYTAVSTAPWLTVAPAAGATPATLTLTATASGLAPGAYSASIVISAPGAASQTVAVSLNIAGAPPAAAQLTFSPAALTFDAAGTKTIAVASTGAPLGFAATANVPWLTVSASSGVTPATVSVTAVPGTLAAGAYTGAVTLTASGASTQTIAVTFNVSSTAAPEIAALVNGASQAAGTAFAPGQIVTLYGRNIGPATGVFGTLATPSRFDTVAGGTRVRFNGILAPVLYTSSSQVNTIVPYEVSGATTVEVEFEGRRSAPIPVRIVEAAPALFTQDASGRGRAAILNQDYGLNTPQRPAARGTVVMLYATGGGQTNPASSTGQIAGPDLRTLALPVTVTIGGRLAETLYAGAAPGLVTGLLQINVLIPADAPIGDGVPLSIQVGTAASPNGTTLSIN
jgi:uncharacterized protein (TIGR03437 family)